MPHGRLRGIAASVVAVAVIALFALLLHSFVPGHRAPSPASSTSLNDVHGRWVTLNTLTFSSDVTQSASQQVAFAQSAPNTVYEISSSQLVVRRSDDSGATWHTLGTPSSISQASRTQVFASPVDAHTLFATLTTQDSTPPGGSCPAVPSGGRKSGYIPCSYQFVSHNGGSTWTAVHLPVQGVLAGITQQFALPGWNVLKAQNNRLYAAVGNGLGSYGPGYRLVASSDGGATWSLVDGGLAGQNVCDFAPSPTGSDVFAITSSVGCDNEALPALSLWRSTDAGATWTRAGELPSAVAESMTVTAGVDAAHPLVYIYMPTAAASPHTVQVQDGPANLRVSADGGQTWQSAPTQGYPNANSAAVPVGVTSDGAILAVGADQQGANATSALYTWKAGQTSWHQVTAPLNASVQAVLVAHGASGGDIYYALTPSGAGAAKSTPQPASGGSTPGGSISSPPTPTPTTAPSGSSGPALTPTPAPSGPSTSSGSATTTFVVQRYLP